MAHFQGARDFSNAEQDFGEELRIFFCVFIFRNPVTWTHTIYILSSSTSMDPWESHVESLLDALMKSQTTRETCATKTVSPHPDTPKPGPLPKRRRKEQHPQFIGARSCVNVKCQASDSDFIVDANGGSVVCIQCGMIQCIGVLESAPIDVDSSNGASVTVVHRYSRIAYVRGLLTSIEGETKLTLTQEEKNKIRHYIKVHTATGSINDVDAQVIKQAVRRMGLRKCLCYHAHTIAFQLYRVTHEPPNETEIRIVLRRFRALENEWDKAPKHGPLRRGLKKFPYIPFIWKKICEDEGFYELAGLIHATESKKRTKERTRIYNELKRLALG